MITVKFEFTDEKMTLRVRGHAGSAPYGLDTICSAASMLSATLAQTMKVDHVRGRLKYAPRLKMGPGNNIISCRPKEDHIDEVLAEWLTIRNGFIVLAYNNPQYVTVEDEGITPTED